MRQLCSSNYKLPISLVFAIWFASVCQGQTNAPTTASAAGWKKSKLAELDRQLADKNASEGGRNELLARRAWLQNWTVGGLTSEPIENLRLPKLRTEPILNSNVATEFRKKLNWENTAQDESDFLILEQALVKHPDDIGLQQLHLHWMDLPIRRKSFLGRIDGSARRLIKSLESQTASDATIQLATEFAKYRRGRALAYRELPDVVQKTPIEDAQRLNREILSAYQDLIATSGTGHSEFILLEIRILRRDKSFGKALALVEKYGSVIKRQWYLKKRRDLLQELGWEFPNAEAATIYANEFPEEVAKEKKQAAHSQGS